MVQLHNNESVLSEKINLSRDITCSLVLRENDNIPALSPLLVDFIPNKIAFVFNLFHSHIIIEIIKYKRYLADARNVHVITFMIA